MSPREGEAFFSSAMMAGPEAAALRRAASNPRGRVRGGPALETARRLGGGAPGRHFELSMRENLLKLSGHGV